MATYTGSDRRLAYLFANGGGGGGSCKVISGYYHNGDFYEDQSYTQIITGSEDSLYIDLDTTTLYLFDGTDYVEVQGGGGGAVSDGTVGFRDSVVINSGASTTYDWSDVGLDKWGSYLISMTGENASGTGYTGVLARTAYIASSWAHSGLYSIRSSNISVSVNDSTKQITFTNTSSYDIGFVIEVLPLHPKIEIPKHTYSTTEQVVGTWIDGKPLYERVITFTGLPQQPMISPGTIDTLTDEEVKRIEVYATIGSMAVLPSGNDPYRNTDNDQIFFNVTINTNNVIRYTLKVGTNSSDTADGWVIIQYTKSTP